MLNEAFPSDDEDEESKESSEQESGELESDEEMEQESDEEPEQESDEEESDGFYVPSDSSNEQITDERSEDYSQQTHDENMVSIYNDNFTHTRSLFSISFAYTMLCILSIGNCK